MTEKLLKAMHAGKIQYYSALILPMPCKVYLDASQEK